MRSLGSREKLSLPSAKPVPSVSLPEIPNTYHPAKLALAVPIMPESQAAFSHPNPLSPSLQSSPLLSPGEWSQLSPFCTPPLTTSSEFSIESTDSLSSATSSPRPRSSTMCPSRHHSCRQCNRTAALATLEGKVQRRKSSRHSDNCISMVDDDESVICSRGEKMSSARARRGSGNTDVVDDDERRQSSFIRLRNRVDSYLASISSFVDFKEDAELAASKSHRSFIELGP